MKKRAYITPVCESFVLLTEGICDLTVSNVQGTGDITIGDGGDNDDDAPDPTAKGTNLWDRWDD